MVCIQFVAVFQPLIVKGGQKKFSQEVEPMYQHIQNYPKPNTN